MATMPQSGKKYSEKKISYVVVQKAIAVRIVQPKHNWKKEKIQNYYTVFKLLEICNFYCENRENNFDDFVV